LKRAKAEDRHEQYGPGGWPGPYLFYCNSPFILLQFWRQKNCGQPDFSNAALSLHKPSRG